MKVVHTNVKKPKKVRKSKPHKKHPKRPIAALLTSAALPREVEREIIVEGKTFPLNLPELSREARALKSDSDTDVQDDVAGVVDPDVHDVDVEVVDTNVQDDDVKVVDVGQNREEPVTNGEEISENAACDPNDAPDVIARLNLPESSIEIPVEMVDVSALKFFPGTGTGSKINVWVIGEDGVTSREITDIVVKEVPDATDVGSAAIEHDLALPVLAPMDIDHPCLI